MNRTGGVGTVEKAYGPLPHGWKGGKNTSMRRPVCSNVKDVSFAALAGPSEAPFLEI